MSSKYKIIAATLTLIFTAGLFSGCSKKADDAYTKEVKEWRKNRAERLLTPGGWLSLVGLHWLQDGENTFGSDDSNDIVFIEKAPAFIGSFNKDGGSVTIKINADVDVYVDSVSVKDTVMMNDISGSPTVFKYGSLSWYLIERAGDKFGIRVKDSESELIKNFEGIESYPVDSTWKIEAEYVQYDPPKKIVIPNIIGTSEEVDCPGKLIFKIDGKEYSLDVQDSGRRFFIVFGDETNGEETYGAGRFITVDKPDSTGKTFIDFNISYNPPCIFTKYATCPLPSKDNILRTKITAGEKNYGAGH